MLEVVKLYTESHRKYHNLIHVGQMFKDADLLDIELNDVQKYAIIFHDVIYYPGKTDNEVKSAEYAMRYLSKTKTMSLRDRQKVCQVILDTKLELATIDDSYAVIDLDLFGLVDRKRFKVASNNIMFEYIRYTHIREEDFYNGRIKWIESFLTRKSIFVGPLNYDRWNTLAINNLKMDLNDLKFRIDHKMEKYEEAL